MEKEKTLIINPIISISKEHYYFSDKSRSENKIFYFECLWFVLTFTSSMLKISAFDHNLSTNTLDTGYFLIVFSAPILIRHFIRFDFFNTLSKFRGVAFWMVTKIVLVFFIISVAFLLFLIMNFKNLDDSEFLYNCAIVFHFVVLTIGLYDKIGLRLKPKIEEE
ncbi:hypothetical protein [Candidatus Enterococcus mansonii]|uniref:Uncharacterized protein n=1 Tax=Candidatus Enterococcus mansonii TaxID=1834181 RepID=A0A242CGY3_9ENTE|nr:hypothetical protein [Enterococcus sp. 4G2_DIV0659]OTO09471.1 hypothetical protein A5880_000150 [Enterococcus sp. 4G2_DIV0659]